MTEIKQIFREPEPYLEQELEVVGWVRNIPCFQKLWFY